MADGATSPEVEPAFRFDNTYVRDLPGFSLDWKAAEAPDPHLLRLNESLAVELGLNPSDLSGTQWARIFSGNAVPVGAHPVAQAYAGHQFGGFSPQLGDGRALLLGEVIDREGHRRDIALKGSGATPFARRGDGKATLGPVLREYLIGEAMHALGVPTTRALAAVTTGETIQRERGLPGAVLTRVAASHIRVGTFQFFAARQETDKLRQLVAYTIARHYPGLTNSEAPALSLLAAGAAAQASLIAKWMSLGFIHGVMNTDNMAISGETIDYGPCAFMDAYDPATVFSSIDQNGRYAYGNQPAIGQWNLARLAEALLPLIDEDTDRAVAAATEVLRAYTTQYEADWLALMRAKLGLSVAEQDDRDLADRLLAIMQEQGADWTLTFRRLSGAAHGNASAFRLQFRDPTAIDSWLADWTARTLREPAADTTRAKTMDCVNPIVVPRNHKVEEALAAAVDYADLGPFDALLTAITDPFDEQPGREAFVLPPPEGFAEGFRTFCGT